jgi:hypothetical protein
MKTICAILLIAGVCSLASAQTSTTPCANGQPYVNGKCVKMPVCALRCIWNTGAPKYVRCFWGPPIPAVECPAGYQACGSTTVNRWGLRLDNERMNGYRCAYTYKRWNGLQN